MKNVAGTCEMIEQPEQARHADARAVFALRHQRAAARELRIFAQRGGFAIDVEAQHRRATLALGPDETRRGQKSGSWCASFDFIAGLREFDHRQFFLLRFRRARWIKFVEPLLQREKFRREELRGACADAARDFR